MGVIQIPLVVVIVVVVVLIIIITVVVSFPAYQIRRRKKCSTHFFSIAIIIIIPICSDIFLFVFFAFRSAVTSDSSSIDNHTPIHIKRAANSPL